MMMMVMMHCHCSYFCFCFSFLYEFSAAKIRYIFHYAKYFGQKITIICKFNDFVIILCIKIDYKAENQTDYTLRSLEEYNPYK